MCSHSNLKAFCVWYLGSIKIVTLNSSLPEWVSEGRSVVSDSLQPFKVHGILLARTLECLSLLQKIFPTQELNPGLPHCRQILHQLSHKGSPIKTVTLNSSLPTLFKNLKKISKYPLLFPSLLLWPWTSYWYSSRGNMLPLCSSLLSCLK